MVVSTIALVVVVTTTETVVVALGSESPAEPFDTMTRTTANTATTPTLATQRHRLNKPPRIGTYTKGIAEQ
jgi:hypothetical protein